MPVDQQATIPTPNPHALCQYVLAASAAASVAEQLLLAPVLSYLKSLKIHRQTYLPVPTTHTRMAQDLTIRMSRNTSLMGAYAFADHYLPQVEYGVLSSCVGAGLTTMAHTGFMPPLEQVRNFGMAGFRDAWSRQGLRFSHAGSAAGVVAGLTGNTVWGLSDYAIKRGMHTALDRPLNACEAAGAGLMAGALTALSTHPLDTLVTRQRFSLPWPRKREWLRGLAPRTLTCAVTGVFPAIVRELSQQGGTMTISVPPPTPKAGRILPSIPQPQSIESPF